MKNKYIRPEINFEYFLIGDPIAASGNSGDDDNDEFEHDNGYVDFDDLFDF
ncbi:MAG: hypothetical protein UD936_08740 [Acutalibacteraceae bacterium]|nr:hypothetical protein [Acutalibacteraceae bacterium]